MRGSEKKKRMGKEVFRVGGYMTVFLSLLITVLLSLFFLLLRGARQSGARMQLESAMSSAENATLAEFHDELFKQYDLFFVDAAYGSGSGSKDKLLHRLQYYLEQNTTLNVQKVEVTRTRYACDQNAQAVAEQIYAYMSGVPGSEMINSVLVSVDRWKGFELSGREWETSLEESCAGFMSELHHSSEASNGDGETDSTSGPTEQDEQDADDSEEMIMQCEKFRRLPLLKQVLGDTRTLSTRGVVSEKLLSNRKVHLGNGFSALNSHGYPRADAILTDLYIDEKCGRYTDKKENGALEYQIEYILCGKKNDRENLEGTARRLLLIRMGTNCTSLYLDEKKMSQVKLIAAAVALVLWNPEIVETATQALSLAWSYLESVQDVRTLLDGGKVPIHKTSEQWQTKLYDLLRPSSAIRTRGAGEGLTYEQYLQGLLFLEGNTTKVMRTMDIMEMDVRQTEGNGAFRLDYCLDAYNANAFAVTSQGYDCSIERAISYN